MRFVVQRCPTCDEEVLTVGGVFLSHQFNAEEENDDHFVVDGEISPPYVGPRCPGPTVH